TFVLDPVSRAVALFACCSLLLVFQLSFQPFALPLVNHVESMLLWLLLCMAAINIREAQLMGSGIFAPRDALRDVQAVLIAIPLSIGVGYAVFLVLRKLGKLKVGEQAQMSLH